MAWKSQDTAIDRKIDYDAGKVLYKYMEDIEPFERYSIGGYYPARINERLVSSSSRYDIVHKLGHGTYSTVWLARDQPRAKYVAIKMAVMDMKAANESDVLRLLHDDGTQCEDDPGMAAIPPLLDEFVIRGPEIEGRKGFHRCLVTAPARMSIADAREASYKRIFQLPVARAIAAQLIKAVVFLHSRGIVHSDLHDGNILFRVPRSIDKLTTQQLYAKYGEPELEPAERLDGAALDHWVPSHGIVPIWLGDACENVSLSECDVLLIDYGESLQPAQTLRYHSHTPYELRAPEMFFEPSVPISFPADVWALACTVFSILGQRSLFGSWFPSEDQIIQEYVDMLGRLPSAWWMQWQKRSEYFHDDLERVDGSPRRSLEERFDYAIQKPRTDCEMEMMPEDEKTALLTLLESMLAFEPKAGLSAQQIVESEWMARWGEPALRNMAMRQSH